MNESRSIIRLRMMRNHLSTTSVIESNNKKKLLGLDPTILKEVYYPFHPELRAMIHKIISESRVFKHYYIEEMTSSEIQRLGVIELRELLNSLKQFVSLKELRSDIFKFMTFMEAVAQFEPSLSIKVCAQSILYYNSIKNIGSSKHLSLLQRADEMKDIGCFAMTEFGHGSNVKELLTTAEYDHSTREFILHSSNYNAFKWWIAGGMGKVANKAVVFAQLIVKEKKQGIHCFVIDLRTQRDHQPCPGVTLGSTGPKLGNEMVDTGFCGFNKYRVPYDALLDKFSSINSKGEFVSSITNGNERFAISLSSLLEGRIAVTGLTQTVMANALCVALRYASIRHQFGSPGKNEERIINYQLVYYRLIPAIADNFAFKICSHEIVRNWNDLQPDLLNKNSKRLTEIHAILAILKPLSTWNSHSHIQRLREVMGAHGYSRFSLIGFFRDCNDANLTWEGDNNVLLQQGTKYLVDNFMKYQRTKKIEYDSLQFMSSSEVKTLNEITNQSQLREISTIRSLLEYRVIRLLTNSLETLSQKLSLGQNNYKAYNESQVFFLQKATLSFGELFVFENFIKKINSLPDCQTKELLMKLCNLFALNSLEKNLDILRENDFVDSRIGNLIRLTILDLSNELKDDAIQIIDVIAPRDEILGSSLGSSDGKVITNINKNWDRYINKIFTHKGCFERAPWWEEIFKQ